ncbi:1-acyl-sn-glycerol-3-phosphate acyltransferase [Lacibacter luteus]|nr:1-acyl-sn-glycerol-3-phosphate acyltransferase [Lacibacter luteus]
MFNSQQRKIVTPMILGVNHPNSFLDAVIVGAMMDHRVHFITRSGVFKNPIVRALLRSVNMIPIYRMSDGKDQLANNDATFEEVRKVLQRGEHVLIFVEGLCIHQTTLQLPLKKGAPRMLLQAWEDGLDVTFLPVWVRYNSFTAFPKTFDFNFGTQFGKEVITEGMEVGAKMVAINKATEIQLQELSTVTNPDSSFKLPKWLLFVPAMLGVLTHFLFYVPLERFAHALRGEQYYDSILFCLMAFLYPLYVLSIGLILYCTVGGWWAFAALLLPLFAKSYVLWK